MIRGFLKFMSLLGLIFAIIMYLLSPVFAKLSGVGKTLIPVMQSLSWAVLIFLPWVSSVASSKGITIWNLSHQSNCWAVIRVIWMLLTAYFIMKVGSGDYVEAVTQSTFAAFIGMGGKSICPLLLPLERQGLYSTYPSTRVWQWDWYQGPLVGYHSVKRFRSL